MGKSPGKWIKTVLFGNKSSKTSYHKEREKVANAKEVLVAVRGSEADVAVAPAPALPDSSQLNPYANERDEKKSELENEEAANISNDDEISLPVTMSQDINSQKSTLQDSEYNPERMKQKQAATVVQAAFRGYLARRAFVALQGIIRLQALIRGYLVRRQAITTLCCMMGIVKLQAHARGVRARCSDGGLEVQKICNQMNLRESKPVVSLGVNMPLCIVKLSANAFVNKLVVSSLPVMPLHLHDDAGDPNSVGNWLERWSASCFWKPVPQQKKAADTKMRRKQANGHVETDTGRPKLSVRRIRSANLDGTSVQATSDFDKPKSNLRKVSSHPAESSVEENPQNVLEKVKRNLRKVHNPVVESSVQSEVDFDKPKLSLEVSSTTNLDIAEQSLNGLSVKTNKETALTVNSSAEKMNEMAMTVNSSTEEMRREMTTRNSSADKMNKETASKINSSAEKMNKEKASKINNSAEKMRQETDRANGSAEKMKKETALTVNSSAEKVKKETALTINNSAEKMKKETAMTVNISAEKIRQEADTVNSPTEKVKKETALTANSSAEKVKKDIIASVNGTAEKMKKEANVVNSSAEKMKKEIASAINISTEKPKKETSLPVHSSAEKVKKEISATVNGSAEKMKKETALTVNSSADKVKKETVATVNGSAQKTKKETTGAVSKTPDIETMPEPFGMNETSDLFHADPSAIDSKPSIGRTVKDENTYMANAELNRKNDSTNENQKSGRKASSPAVPSYMAATESAKAKLRLQGSPQSSQDGAEKNNLTRRQSLPFSANSKISSQSPRTQRLVHSGKEGSISDRSLSSRDKSAKAAQVEWKR